MDERDDWELSKENVQPLKEGRKVANLSMALHANSSEQNTRIRSERQEYEMRIRTYDGTDPLSVWDSYIKWTEQNFPKGGKDSHLTKLLECCVAKFKDNETYKNDERYLRIWLKFANFCSDPLDIFSYLYDHQIGHRLSLLYETWSSELERVGNFQKADIVFEKGQQIGAEPGDHLRKKHSEFQTRVARLTLRDEDGEENMSSSKQRCALGELKTTGFKARVSSDRVNSLRKEGPKAKQTSVDKALGNQGSGAFKVFCDEDLCTPSLPAPSGEWAQAPGRSERKENEQKASVWTTAKVKQRQVPNRDFKEVSSHVQNQFSVFEDENQQIPSQTPRKPIEVNPVLSARKSSKSQDLFIHMQHLNDASNTRPMYPKHLVYTGAGEMSLEELRAAAWRDKQLNCLKGDTSSLNSRPMYPKHRVYSNAGEMSLEELKAAAWRDTQLKMQIKAQAETLDRRRVEIARQQEEIALQQQAMAKQQETLRIEKEQFLLARENFFEKHHSKQESTSMAEAVDGNLSNLTDGDKALVHIGNRDMLSTEKSEKSRDLSLAIQPPPSAACDQAPSSEHSFENTLSGRGMLNAHLTDNIKNSATLRPSSFGASSPTVNTREAMNVIKGMFYDTADIEKDLGWQESMVNLGEEDAELNDQFAATLLVAGTTSDRKPLCHFSIYEENASPKKASPCVNKRGESLLQHLPMEDEVGEPDTKETQSGLYIRETISPGKSLNRCDDDKENNVMEPRQFDLQQMTIQEKLQKANMDWDVTEQTQIITSDQASMEVHDFDCGDMTFAPGMSSTVNFTAAARLASTPYTSTAVGLPDPSISHIQIYNEDLPLTNTTTATDQKDELVTEKRRISQYADGAGTNLSPILEQSDEDKQHAVSKSGHSVFANTTHQASHSQFCGRDGHGYTMGIQTPKPLVFSVNEQSVMPTIAGDGRESVTPPIASPGKVQNIMNLSDEKLRVTNYTHKAQLNDMTMHEIDVTNYIPADSENEERQLLLDQSVAIDPNDPFDEELVARFLSKLATPLRAHRNYTEIEDEMPTIKTTAVCKLGSDTYRIESKLGEGAFAAVYKCSLIENACSNEDMDVDEEYKVIKDGFMNIDYAGQVQSPACPWEFYISQELHTRLTQMDVDYDIRPSVMCIEHGYFFRDGSCLVNELHSNGTLLDMVNTFKEIGFTLSKSKNSINQLFYIYLTIELLHIAEKLQAARIIHGDIKPDNILIIGYPFQMACMTPEELVYGKSKMLKLIDFGRSIDLNMFPENSTFTAKVTTSGFQCIEMMTNRPWTFQTDLFGIIGCMHVLLFEEYMKVYQEGNTWKPTRSLTRYVSSNGLYKKLFHDLLNIPSCNEMPNLRTHRHAFEKFFLDELKSEKRVDEFKRCLNKVSVARFRKQ